MSRFRTLGIGLLGGTGLLGGIGLAAAIAIALAAAGVAQAGEVHWTYEGHEGPEHWGSLSEDFAACSEGRMQSPIDVSGTAAGGAGEAAFDYRDTALELVNNGHTVQVNVGGDSRATLAGRRYTLLQFHFHSPSEHTVGGRHYDMEAHFVHRGDDGKLAVVGVFMEAGGANGALQAIWDHMPVEEGSKTVTGVSVNAAALLPATYGFTTYAGSLTTPPCSEGVSWFVMKQPVAVSAAQVEAFRAIMPANNRPAQPLNGRMTLSSN